MLVANTDKKSVLTAAAVAIVALLVFLPDLQCGFVNMDDPAYVLNNFHIRMLDADLFRWAFSPPTIDLWIPLTWLSFALDYHFWGLDPFGYHLTNNLLHAANTALVVLIAWRLTEGDRNGDRLLRMVSITFAGALFAIHPLRVESVAWISERKDVLNGFFVLAALYCYLDYLKAGRDGRKSGRYFALSLVFMLCSLLAKPISVVLPVLFLLLDIFPLCRNRTESPVRLLREKAPYVVLALVFVAIAFLAARHNRILAGMENITLMQRLVVSGNAIFEYCRMSLWPTGIIPHFIIPDPIPMSYGLKSCAVLFFTCFVCLSARRRTWPVVTWLLFLTPFLPVLAFFQNGIQNYAARYTYLPSAMIAIVMAPLLAEQLQRAETSMPSGREKRMLLPAVVIVLLLALLTRQQIAYWKDSAAYWSRVIALQPYDLAYLGRGLYYLETGDYGRAEADFTAAVEMGAADGRPGLDNIYAYRGEALLKQGKYLASAADYSRAIAISPRQEYFLMRDKALDMAGKPGEQAE
jgi:tetratricopeptide (TPR) repeat protein